MICNIYIYYRDRDRERKVIMKMRLQKGDDWINCTCR